MNKFQLFLPFHQALAPNGQILATTHQVVTPEMGLPMVGTKQTIAVITLVNDGPTSDEEIARISQVFPDFFYPIPLKKEENLDLRKADAFEVHPLLALCDGVPVIYEEAEAFDHCEESEATCFGLFSHVTGSGLHWIADYSSYHHAHRAIIGLCQNNAN